MISKVDAGAGEIVGLVYVNGFVPDAGETCFALAAMFRGSMLGETKLRLVPRSDGTTELFITWTASTTCSARICPLPRPQGWPPRSDPPPRKRSSSPPARGRCGRSCRPWFLIGESDHVIPAELQRYMAERAGARRTVEIPGASHAALVSHPDTSSQLILEAAASRVAV